MTTKKQPTKQTKKAPAKSTKTRAVVTKSTKTSRKQAKPQSLRLQKSDVPFMTISPSKQSLYWIILGVVVIGFAVWILQLQADIDALYTSIPKDTTVQTTE